LIHQKKKKEGKEKKGHLCSLRYRRPTRGKPGAVEVLTILLGAEERRGRKKESPASASSSEEKKERRYSGGVYIFCWSADEERRLRRSDWSKGREGSQQLRFNLVSVGEKGERGGELDEESLFSSDERGREVSLSLHADAIAEKGKNLKMDSSATSSFQKGSDEQ